MLETTSEVLKKYKAREPEKTVLYKAVSENIDEFLASFHAESGKKPLPGYVTRELRGFLDCGIPEAIGYSIWGCEGCEETKTIPHSCKKRGFCPSCGGRRMAQNAANIVDNIFPNSIPLRQWVISLPFELRYWVAADAVLHDEINTIINHTIGEFYLRHTKATGAPEGQKLQYGSIAFIQRSGGSLNCNPHFHICFAEGLYDQGVEGIRGPRFYEAKQPSNEDVATVTRDISQQIIQLLIDKKMIKEEEDFCQEEVPQTNDPLFAIRQASVRGYIALGLGKNKMVRRVGSLGEVDEIAEFKGDRCYSSNGFSVHANRRVKKHRKQEREKLLRYMARPPLSLDRLSEDENGDIILQLKNVYSDGTHALKFTGLEILERLSSIIPPPWKNLTRYFGFFAPNCKIRSEIVPKPLRLQETGKGSSDYWIPWSDLLKRVFLLDILECSCCSGRLRFMAAVGPEATPRGPPDSDQASRSQKEETPETQYCHDDIEFP